MAATLSSIFLVLFLLPITLLWRRFKHPHKSSPLPPGPKRWPFIGCLLQMPKVFEHETYREWCRQYDSDIIYMNVLGQSIVVIDKYETAVELLDKRSGIYSSRPISPVLELIPGWGDGLGLLPYGDHWRRQRRLFAHVMNEKQTVRFESLIEKARNRLLNDLIQTPGDWLKHISFMPAITMFSIAYGLRCDSREDPLFIRMEKVVEATTVAILPTQFLVNVFPALKHLPSWMPGGSFKKWIKPLGEESRSVRFDAYNLSKKKIEQGTATTSFISESLQTVDPDKMTIEEEEILMNVAIQMYAGGTETVAAHTRSFILAMVLHPEVQKKAHEEISQVCDSSQLPSYDDMDSLPFVTAIALEVLRWTAAVPNGLPHYIDTDDIYNGHLVPRGTMVLANQWSMTRDEEVYPNAESFKPERFIKDGALNKEIRDPRDIVFGFGRRICPGRHMAFSSLWMTFAAILAALEIAESDETVLPQDGRYFTPGAITLHTVPFKCSIKPRSGMSLNLIKSLQQRDS